jgi:hypothetical protein
VSFDDGDNWQSLQLNMPVTSMRDLEIHGNDLIAATHGRGFWLIDDISALRQINSDVASADAFLFKPSAATIAQQGGDNGTPTQKDEAFVPNPPNGASIDYYLKSAASGPVTLEILDASGQTIRSYSSQAAGPGANANANAFPPNVTVMWRPVPESLSGAAGLHRWYWDFRPDAGGAGRAGGAGGRGGRGGGGGGGGGGRGGAPASGAGQYTVKLTVNGKSYTQPLTVKASRSE